jgi:hypothetical protein
MLTLLDTQGVYVLNAGKKSIEVESHHNTPNMLCNVMMIVANATLFKIVKKIIDAHTLLGKVNLYDTPI